MIVSHLFLSPAGRLGRRDFVLAGAGLLAGGLLVSALPVVGPVAALALTWPWWAIAAKRLHDLGRSATLATVGMGVNAAIGLVAAALAAGGGLGAFGIVLLPVLGLIALLSTAALLAALALVVWLALTPGEAAANRYGAPARPLDLPALLG